MPTPFSLKKNAKLIPMDVAKLALAAVPFSKRVSKVFVLFAS